MGNDHPVICPYGTFQAQDGEFNMGAVTQEMWIKLCRLLDLGELASHPDFANNSARLAHREELCRRLNERFGTRGRMEWTRTLVALGIPAGPVLNIGEMFADPHVIYSRLAERTEHPVIGPLQLLANPVRLDCFRRGSVRTPPPLLGEDTEAALRDYGIAAERISAFEAEGVVGQGKRKPLGK
jgi:crotonobetainyl-CoA:carnitine CoA-transferase CaiB-like acyl-CoA transferase